MLYSSKELNDSEKWFEANMLELIAKHLNVDIRSLQLQSISERKNKTFITLNDNRKFQIDENLNVSEI